MSDSLVVAAAALALPIVVGFVVTALATRPLIGWLKRRQLGKTFREDGPSHQGKAGTPTMGGLALVLSMVFMTVGFGDWSVWQIDRGLQSGLHVRELDFQYALLVRVIGTLLIAIVAFGAIGFLDDWQGLARKGRMREPGVGLSARRLLALQVVVAVGLSMLLAHVADSPTNDPTRPAVHLLPNTWATSVLSAMTWVPATVVSAIGYPAWIVLSVVIILGTVNGVNLSDGLDGLAPGLAAMAFPALGLVSLRLSRVFFALHSQSQYPPDHTTGFVLVFTLFVSGACLGFLVHNRYPAKVFMGNVASMALGGALATIALATGTWPLLPVIGIVYVAEVLSDIIQIGYFKWSGGKRVFRMAPLHHHFELGGMHETAVTHRFWLAGAIGAAVAVGFVYYATWGV